MKCSRATCDRSHYAFGLCHGHYDNASATGALTTGMTDSTKAREHVEWLVSEGVSLGEITRMSGVGWPALKRMRTAEKVLRRTEEKLLTVSPDWRRREAGEAKVPAIGTARRLQALVAIGYTGQYLGGRLGCPKVTVWRITSRAANVEVNTARAVSELFDELSMIPGPCDRARRRAKKYGWVPPLAFDDVDDPDEIPNPGERVYVSTAERINELHDLGITNIHDIAARLGIKPESVERAKYERGAA